MAAVPDAVRAWTAAHWIDITIATALTVLAAMLRFWNLDGMPPGLHGDEAWTGIDARRVLDEGWIGPYVPSAVGQPTGPVYWTAFLFTFLPETVTTLRLSIAILGALTIPLTYAAFSVMFNRSTGFFAALLLAVLTWHLHLSRTGFMVASWPLMEVAVLWTLWLAFRHRTIWLYLLSGLLLGLGVHSYNAYLLFAPIPFVALALMPLYAAVRHAWRRRSPSAGAAIDASTADADIPAVLRPGTPTAYARYGVMCLAFAAAAALGATPLLRYANEHEDDYRSHHRLVSLFEAPRWEDAGFSERADLIWDRAKHYHRGLSRGDDGKVTSTTPGKGNEVETDFVDGLAAPGHRPIDPLIYFFGLAGVVLCIVNIRRPAYAVALLSLVLLPLGALLTIDGGMYRRTLGLAPFVALFAAIPLAAIWDHAWAGARQSVARAWPYMLLAGAVAVVPAVAGVRATTDYFDRQDEHVMRLLFAPEFTQTSQFIDDIPDGTDIYFYSDRWRFDHEARRFLAPGWSFDHEMRRFIGRDAAAYDRSRVTPEEQTTPPDLDIESRDHGVAMIFMGRYAELAAEAEQRYPGGTLVADIDDGVVMYVAYLLPADPD